MTQLYFSDVKTETTDQYDLVFPLYSRCSASRVLAGEDEEMLYRCLYCSPVVLNTRVT